MKSITKTSVIIIFCAFLLAYVGFILCVNFRTELQRNRLLSDLFTTEASHIKRQIDFLLTAYLQMLENLSSDRIVTAYYINKRMGMSEAYGLLVSRMEVMKLLDERSCHNGSDHMCFSSLMLIEDKQKVLFRTGENEPKIEILQEFLRSNLVFPVPSERLLCATKPVIVESQPEGYLTGCLTDKLILTEAERYIGKESKLVKTVVISWKNTNTKLVFRYSRESGWESFWDFENEDYLLNSPESQLISFNILDGSVFVDIYSQPLPLGIQNAIAYVLGIFALICLGVIAVNWQRVIHQLADLNLKLAQKAREAEEASQAKTRYVSYISHEIRTPLNYILGYSQIMLLDESLPEDKKTSIRPIVKGCELIIRIINEVLDIAKLESGHIEIKHEAFSLEECFKELKETMELGALQKNIALKFEHHGLPEEGLTLVGDKLKIQQVIMNFIGNAIKFTPEGKEVRVETRVEQLKNGKVELTVEVRDSGPGLTPEEKEKVFLPFYQTDLGALAGGTGLGMYFARKLLEIMGGTVEVESEAGKGTSIRFRLIMDCISSDEIQEICDKVPSLNVLRLSSPLRVIICDDDARTRSVLNLWFKKAGFIVEEADRGKGLMEKINSFKPDIVLNDMVLPDTSGINCIREIRENENGRNVKINSDYWKGI
ncbi:MAG: ATP-binding response regulator [Thermodesulforhabdaceae bacterium]